MSDFKLVDFKLNGAGVREVLKLPAMAQMCMSAASNIANQCGPGYVAESRSYPERTGAAVYPATPEAAIDNYRHNTLLRNKG